MEEMIKRLKSSNNLLRSTLSIAKRWGAETNWVPFIKQIEVELQEQHQLLKTHPAFLLCELLAVIHGDGGHYTEEHGVEKSVKDAFLRIADLQGIAGVDKK